MLRSIAIISLLLVLMVGACVVALSMRTPTPPQIAWGPDAHVPPISLEREWKALDDFAQSIKWSPDGTRLISVSSFGKWLNVQDLDGNVEQKTQLPIPFTYHLVINPQTIVMHGNLESDIAFSVIRLGSNDIVFQERMPAGIDLHKAHMAIHFSLSADGRILAVAYGGFLPGQPMSLYDTQNWRKLTVISLPPIYNAGVGPIAFSRDRDQIAFGASKRLVVVDALLGTVISEISVAPGFSTGASFSPDGRMIATLVTTPSDVNPGRSTSLGIRIVQLSDQTVIGSHPPPPIAEAECKEEGQRCGWNMGLRWHPSGRFVAFEDDLYRVTLWNPFIPKAPDATIGLRYLDGELEFSPDGSRLVVSDSNLIRIFKIGG